MKVLGVVGPPDAGRSALVERLVERLDGRVAVVDHRDESPLDTGEMDVDRHQAAGAETAYCVRDGSWFGTGSGMDIDDVLVGLAPDHDYAVVDGSNDASISQVVLGGYDHGGTALVEAETPEAVDVDAVCEALADVEPLETLESLIARIKRSPRADRAGAIATFTGRVRERDDSDDPPTEYLEFEKYEGVADDRMAQIEAELTDREGVVEVLLHHRTGVVSTGEDIVFVVVLSGHRREAFRTVEDGIDRLKDEVPLFKKEVTVEDTFWVHDQD